MASLLNDDWRITRTDQVLWITIYNLCDIIDLSFFNEFAKISNLSTFGALILWSGFSRTRRKLLRRLSRWCVELCRCKSFCLISGAKGSKSSTVVLFNTMQRLSSICKNWNSFRLLRTHLTHNFSCFQSISVQEVSNFRREILNISFIFCNTCRVCVQLTLEMPRESNRFLQSFAQL